MRDSKTLEFYIRRSTGRWESPGMVPLVTEGRRGVERFGMVHLWAALRTVASQMTQEDRDSLERLRTLVDEHLPVSLGLPVQPPVPTGVQVLDRRWLGATEGQVSGRSRDLSIALSLASQRLGVPLRANLFASGQLDADGHVLSVEGLTHKAIAATSALHEDWGPIQFMVSDRNGGLEEASQAVRLQHGLAPVWVRVATLREAFNIAFGWSAEMTDEERLGQIHTDATSEEGSRDAHLSVWADHQLRRAFYGHTSGRLGRGDIKEWKPIHQAHTALLNLVPADNPNRERFEWAVATSARHSHRESEVSLPSNAVLEQCPVDVAVGWVSHIVQQATDTGNGNDVVEALLARWLPSEGDLTAAELRLLGARGRRRQAQGRLQEAWDDSMAAAQGWIDRFEASHATYPLSVLYLLVGTWRSPSRLNEVDDLLRIVEPDIEPGSLSLTFVLAARFRALVQLGDRERAEDCDRRLRQHGVMIANVAPGLVRWRLALRRLDEKDAPLLEDQLLNLREEQPDFLRLLERLHQAVERQNRAAADVALAELAQKEGMIRTHLLPHCPHRDPIEQAEWLLRHYPYF